MLSAFDGGAGPDGVSIERYGALADMREPWLTVAERSGNLFATWEWTTTWWRHFGRGRPLVAAIARCRDGRPCAIVPLYVARRTPVTVLRFLGHGPADWLGPIHAPQDTELAAVALRRTLAQLPRWDLLVTENTRPAERWPQRLGGSVVRRAAFPILRCQGLTWDDLLARRSANFRSQVRRRERRLARSHKLTYRLSDESRLDADLDLLFRLHEARWGARGSDAFSEARVAFHRDFARIALSRGWLRLWVMTLDDEPAAVWYGFRYAGNEWYYQSGRDPAREAQSVGFVLLCHTIRSALEDGVGEYWFLRGGEAYKARFADEDPSLETALVAHGPRGHAALQAIRGIDRLAPAVRRWAVRRS